MYHRILLTLDGSEASAATLPWAKLLAKGLGSEVVVFRAHHDRAHLDYPDLHPEPGPEAAEVERYVEEVAESLRGEGLVATSATRAAAAPQAIAAFSEEAKPSLIVMATHGRTGLQRWALGSVAEKVLRTSAWPMLLLRAFPHEGDRVTLRQVVVPVDGSDRALEVVPWVAALVRPFGAAVRVVHFVSDYARKEAMPVAERYLEEAAAAFAGHDLAVELDLRRGNAAAGLADFGLLDAGREPPDLIAMTTHGRSGLSRMILGSVTEKVLRATGTPMLVVPTIR